MCRECLPRALDLLPPVGFGKCVVQMLSSLCKVKALDIVLLGRSRHGEGDTVAASPFCWYGAPEYKCKHIDRRLS